MQSNTSADAAVSQYERKRRYAIRYYSNMARTVALYVR